MDQVIMTPEKQRIAIAEACGWTEIQPSEYAPFGKPYLVGRSPNKFVENLLNIPDFRNDLNAMHDAEKMLDVNIESEDSPRYEYSRQVYRIVESRRQPFRSTAAQRAEAFLRTIGKWEESA
jgi:protein associated with RNAse G/E